MIRNKCPSQTNVLFYSLPIVMVVKEQVQQQEQNGAYAASECFIARTPFDWFIDSGTSESFTDQRQIIENFKPITIGSWTVSGIGGMSLEVHGRGDVHIIAEVYPLIIRILV